MPRCRTCGIRLTGEEKDFCAAHARARIDNTGTVEELRRPGADPDDPQG